MHILKIPFAAGGMNKTKGVEEAPEKIVEQLKKLTCNEQGYPSSFTQELVEINNEDINKAHEQVVQATKNKSNIIILGGNHALSYSAMKATCTKEDGLIIFDAHPDCEETTNIPTHEDYLRALIEEDKIDPKKIILIGIRNQSPNEKAFLKKHNINCFTMQKIEKLGFDEVIDVAMEQSYNNKRTYVSIDIDVVDPAFAPGTGYPEPGGITSRQMISAVQRIKKLKNLHVADLVEVNPTKDINNTTVKLAAKLAKELL